MTSPTQADQILLHLQSGQTITPIEALELFRCFRLAARIADLKALGHNILTEMVENAEGKRYARYSLVRPVPFQIPLFDAVSA